MSCTSSISRKSHLASFLKRLAGRRIALHAIVACLMFFFLASASHAQMQFNGIAGVLPINGETLGAQDHAVSDQQGNVYITDPTTNQVFKVDVHGNATVLISSSTLFNGVAMSGPDGIAVDLSGNLYIADTYNDRIITLPAGGTPTLLAVGIIQPTNLAVDNSGDVYVSVTSLSEVIKLTPPTESATSVTTSPYTLNSPQGTAVDISGAVYIADTGNARVLKVSGGTTTVINTGSIALNLPVGVTVDGLGNIFIADAQNSQVVEVPASGTPSIVGTGSEVLANPDGISFDSKGNAYIMDAGNDRVVTVNNTAVNFGTVVVGGSGVTIPLTFTIDPGTPVGATSITSGGITSSDFSVSSTTCTYGTTATSCSISVTFAPKTVGIRKAVLVIKNQSAAALVSVPLNGAATGPILAFTPGTISTVAGSYNEYGAPSVGGFPIATSALLEEPRNIVLDDAGNFYFLDYGNWVVRKVTPAGYISTVLGSGGSARWFDNPSEGDCGPALSASISALWGVGIDAANDIYIADYGMNQIREEGLPVLSTTCTNPPAPLSSDIFTFAGIWDPYYQRTPYGGDGGPALNAELTTPWAVLPDNAGNVFFSDYGNAVIRKVSPNGVITTVAGNDAAGRGYSGDGHPAVQAQLYAPEGLALDAAGDLFIADSFNNVIREVTPEGIISTVAGNYALGAGYSGDNGPATGAQLSEPIGVSLDGGGNLYIADTGNNAIRMVTPGGTISTVAVFGPCNPPNDNDLCYTGTDAGVRARIPLSPLGAPAGSLIYQPYSVAAEPNGNLFLSDENGNVIDKIDVSDPPTLTFPAIAAPNSDIQQDVIIQNLGTAPLNISQFSITSDFTFGSDTTCSLSSTVVLDQNQSCVLGIVFTPQQPGNVSGSVVITDNSQGSNGSTQTIPLNGTGAPLSPTITSVSPIVSAQTQTITISGSGFGSQANYTGDSNYIQLVDSTGTPWAAGHTGNGVTLAVSLWTDSQIVLSGLSGGYGPVHCIRPGDQLSVSVWNAQTGNGPASYAMVASGGTDNCSTQITSVSPIVSQQTQTITISGAGFGTQAAYTGDSNYIELVDSTGTPWAAGHTGNGINLAVSSWTDSQIVLTGFSGSYGTNHCIRPGDHLSVSVWNAQTGTGTATYSLVASGGTDNCPTEISSVSAILPQQTQTMTITGAGFGTQAAYNGDSNYIELTDITRSWNAGHTGNGVTLDVSSWTDSQIVLTGFAGSFGPNHCIQPGDHLSVSVWNAQTGTGPAIYPIVASNGTNTCP
jgi:sugar lactone lactonase YvrE/protein involved in polysaccharide export with SLBB domain